MDSTAAPGQESAPRVVAVVVTYNREQLLAQCLDGLAAPERRPDAVAGVDNAPSHAPRRGADEHPPAAHGIDLRTTTRSRPPARSPRCCTPWTRPPSA